MTLIVGTASKRPRPRLIAFNGGKLGRRAAAPHDSSFVRKIRDLEDVNPEAAGALEGLMDALLVEARRRSR
jgi:hypothetical protein